MIFLMEHIFYGTINMLCNILNGYNKGEESPHPMMFD